MIMHCRRRAKRLRRFAKLSRPACTRLERKGAAFFHTLIFNQALCQRGARVLLVLFRFWKEQARLYVHKPRRHGNKVAGVLKIFFENVVKHRKVLFQNKRHRDVHDVHAVCRDKL